MNEILHVRIVDDLTGKELADIDAASTADGLAYFLVSRCIDEDATELSVADAAGAGHRSWPTKRETIVREDRGVLGELLFAIFAEVH